MEVLFEPGQTCVANVGPVNEAKQVEESDGGNNVQVNLPPQTRLGLGVEFNQGMPVAVLFVSIEAKSLDGTQ